MPIRDTYTLSYLVVKTVHIPHAAMQDRIQLVCAARISYRQKQDPSRRKKLIKQFK